MNKLTAKQLLAINQQFTNQTLKFEGRIKDQLTEISEIPYQKDENFFFVYKDTIVKAAKLGCLIAKKRPFISNNTKTSVVALMTLLEINGIKLDNYQNDISELISSLESDKTAECVVWINKHISESKEK